MVAITAIYDPQGAAGTKIHIYHTVGDQNLGFQFRNEENPHDKNPSALSPGNDSHPGIVLDTSHLSSTTFNNKEFVFGFTKKRSGAINGSGSTSAATPSEATECPPPGEEEVNVSLVSPVYSVVGKTEKSNYKIASCSSSDNTWIYYLSKDEDKALRIQEAVIGQGNPDIFRDTTRILTESSLAAYYLPGESSRYVIYQAHQDGTLREYYIDGKTDSGINNASPKKQCTMGVAVTATKVYLYYVDENDMLRKIVKTIGKGWDKFSTLVDAAKSKVDPKSQIGVTIANESNHIFYEAKDQNPRVGLYHVIDPQ